MKKQLLRNILMISVFLSASMLLSFYTNFSSAAIYGNFYYALNTDNTVTITGYADVKATSIVIPELISDAQVSVIDKNAFADCTKITSITIPSTVTKINTGAFSAPLLQNIQVSTSNTHFSSDGIALYNADQTELIQYPRGNAQFQYAPSNYVEKILDNAFANSTYLSNVVLPNNLVEIGNYAFYNCPALTSVTYRNRVTSIGEYAFANCKKLADNTFPDSLITINNNAFENCASLTNISLPIKLEIIGDSAFLGCIGLTDTTDSITGITQFFFPETLKKIGAEAFSGCKAIKNITLPSNIEKIDYATFYGCSSLTNVEFPESLISIGDSAFYGCSNILEITLKNNLRTIGNNAFQNCTKMTIVTFYNGIETIGDQAFYKCTSINSLHLPLTISSIGKEAFAYCTKLKSVDVPALLETVSQGMFMGCTGLIDVNLQDGIKSIGDKAFYGCTILADFTLPNYLESIGTEAFYNCKKLTEISIPGTTKQINDSAFLGCAGLITLSINDGVEAIGPLAFSKCTSVKEIYIPPSVKSIGAQAFLGCNKLTTVTLSDGLEEISDDTFSGCSSIATITLPAELKHIGNTAFKGCKALKDIYFPQTLVSIGNSAFEGSALETLLLPDSVTSIGEASFKGCTNLNTIYLSKNLSVINKSAFSGCSKLAQIYLKEGLSIIDDYAFYNCKVLTKLELPSTVTAINESAFSGCTLLASVNLNEGLKLIGPNSFKSCKSGLTSITIPSTVTNIGASAFSDCSVLSSVTLSEGLVSIDTLAFNNCKSLTSIAFPTTVTTINQKAFYNCTSMRYAIFWGNAPDTFGATVFGNSANGFIIYVFDSSIGFTIPTWNTYTCTTLSVKSLSYTLPYKLTYSEGDAFDPTGFTLTVTFDNGTTEKVTNYTLSGYTSTPGIKTIIVSYLTAKTSFEVSVIDRDVIGFDLIPPSKVSYSQNDTMIDTTGLQIISYYSDGTFENIRTSDYRVRGFDPNRIGTQVITVNYMGFEKTFTIVVVSSNLKEIVVTPPKKTEYIEGQSLDKTGMIVTANYYDGTSEEIYMYDLLYDISQVGPKTVFVTYANKTTYFNVLVLPKTVESITITPPNKTVYILNENFDKKGMVVTANYNNGLSEVVSDYVINGFNPNVIGEQEIIVYYLDVSATFIVHVVKDTSETKITCTNSVVASNVNKNTNTVTFDLLIYNQTVISESGMMVVAVYDAITNQVINTNVYYQMIDTGAQLKTVSIYVNPAYSLDRCYFKIFLWGDSKYVKPIAKTVRHTTTS